MTMQSPSLLPALLELPVGNDGTHQSFRDIITSLVSTDRAMYAAEFASGASFGLWYVFDDRSIMGINVPGMNVDDSWRETMTQAHEVAFPSEVRTATEHWQDVVELNDSVAMNNTFMSPIKGKIAEIKVVEQLEQDGFTEVSMAEKLNQEGWDISAFNDSGEQSFYQVKTGVSDSQYYKTLDAMENTDYDFHVGTEIYDKTSESHPELVDRLTDIGPDHELVDGITDGLTTLSVNMGIDVPDGIVEIVPFAGAILTSARLIHSVIRTEREFQAVDRTAKNKIQVVQTLTLMSRMGINTVLATVGGMGGTAIGSALPGIGNLVGGIGGTIVGAGTGMYLNQHLQPHMLDLALNITGLGHDDLFYYKNKVRIDEVALSFRQTGGQLAAVPRLPALPAAA